MFSRALRAIWRRWLHRRATVGQSSRNRKPGARFRLCLEPLEDRTAPAILTVNSLADNTVATGALTLREAILLVDGTLGRGLTAGEQAQVTGTLGNNNRIQFNLPSGPQTITLTAGPLSITSPVTVSGPGSGNLTISGNNRDRVLIVGHDYSQNLNLVAAMSGLTITGGLATDDDGSYGGGLLNFGTLTVSNCTWVGNMAGSSGGGAIYNDGALTVSNCTFSGNTVTDQGPGGAIQNASSSTVTVANCLFSGNTATAGGSGAGLANSGTMTVSASTFSNNTASSTGGGIYNSEEGILTISGSTFANNSASSSGGGIRNSGTLAATNSTFAGNSAGSQGGGINNTASIQLTNCTLTANRVTSTSSGDGGGLHASGAAKLFNTIVAGNFQGAAPGTTASDVGGSLDTSSAFNVFGTGGSGNLSSGDNNNQVGVSNPALGTLANNGGPTQTIALLPGSPAIGTGSNTYVTTGETDQRGLARIVNGTVDIGAFEVQTTSSSDTLSVTGFPFSVTAGVAATFTVTAQDASGNTLTSYRGTVHFTSSDGQAVLPANYTFVSGDNGVHAFSATLKTAGSQSLTATDTTTASVTGTQPGIIVNPVSGAVLTVNSLADNTTADNGLTLREAILLVDGTLGRSLTASEQAQVTGTLGNNNTIQFSLPSGTQTILLTGGTLPITKNVTIVGPGAGLLAINGNNAVQDFSVGSGSPNLNLVVSMNNLTITGGKQVGGSGVSNSGSLTLTNVTVSNNVATTNGGGIFNNGALTLTNCMVTGNTASGQGGAVASSGTLSISGSTFAGNSAVSDGGAIHSNGTLTVTTTTFGSNKSGADGGAIRADISSTFTMTACTVTGNTAVSEGGGIDASIAASAIIANSTIATNSAGSIGGGLNCSAGALLVNDTIIGNRVVGIYGGGVNIRSPGVFLGNTIVAGNYQGLGTTPNDITGYNFSSANYAADPASSHNLIGAGGAGGMVNGGNGNQVGVTNLGLGLLASNGGPTQTFALLPGSPAIARGSTAYVNPGQTDQRGLPRTVDGTVDIGAFEVQTPSAAVASAAAFVVALYQAELGRAGDVSNPNDAGSWVNALANGTLPQAQVAAYIHGSYEARDRVVKGWYMSYLGRQANGVEEAVWVNALATQAEEYVLSRIPASTEFYSHAQTLVNSGTPDQRFVQSLYQLVLGRTVGAGEVAGWVNELSRIGQQGMALGFLTSQEYRSDIVTSSYNTYLHRAPGPGELSSWVSSNLDLGRIRLYFESSPEF